MRNLVLVALVLQLLLTLKEANGYNFGDIISFRTFLTYKHYAVYVGDVDFPGKKPGQDIFHRTGTRKSNSHCGFGVLAKNKRRKAKANYLDGLFPGQMGTAAHRAQMIERIKYMSNKANCGTYSLLKNNCEHLATLVRYGYRVSVQPGTISGLRCKTGLKHRCSFRGEDIKCGRCTFSKARLGPLINHSKNPFVHVSELY